MFFFFFKHNTAYEMRISDWSSDVCSSDLFAGKYRKAIDAAKTNYSAAAPTGKPISGNTSEAAPDARDGRARQPVLSLFCNSEVSFLLPELGRATCRERVCQ